MPPRHREGKRDLAAAGGRRRRRRTAPAPAPERGFRPFRAIRRRLPDCLDLAAFGPQSAALMNPQSGTPKRSKQAERDQRLAAALRENLRRRKAQARARTAASGGADRMGGAARPGPAEPQESEP
jgi:hypothetical protein